MIAAFLLLIALAGICKAVSDSIAHGKIRFTGDQWNWEKAWRFKWKNGDPAQGEAFPFSSTALVSFTDFWHLANMIQYWCLFLALPAYALALNGSPWWWYAVAVVGGRVLFTGTFEVFYRWVLKKEPNHPQKP